MSGKTKKRIMKPKGGTKLQKRGKPVAGSNVVRRKKAEQAKRTALQKERTHTRPIARKTRATKKQGGFWETIGKCCAGPDVQLSGMAKATVDLLGIKPPQILRVREQFDLIDIDGSGEIDYDEFFEFIEEKRSPYSDALFALIDEDGSGTINFEEFIQVLSTYCMYGRDEILKFCFDTFDRDASGTIDETEFIDLCKTINNAAPMFPANFKRALQQFDKNEDGLIDFEEFKEINRRYPMVMFPAFRLQDQMQKHTLGEQEWAKLMGRQELKKRIDDYRQTHHGSLPPKPWGMKLRDAFCCSDTYAAVMAEEGRAVVYKRPERSRKKRKDIHDAGVEEEPVSAP